MTKDKDQNKAAGDARRDTSEGPTPTANAADRAQADRDRAGERGAGPERRGNDYQDISPADRRRAEAEEAEENERQRAKAQEEADARQEQRDKDTTERREKEVEIQERDAEQGRKELEEIRDQEDAAGGDIAWKFACQIRFSDGEKMIASIPAIETSPGDFDMAGGRGSYNQPIRFPPQGPPETIDEVWLLGGGKAVMADIHPPMQVGGGLEALLPANSLIF